MFYIVCDVWFLMTKEIEIMKIKTTLIIDKNAHDTYRNFLKKKDLTRQSKLNNL